MAERGPKLPTVQIVVKYINKRTKMQRVIEKEREMNQLIGSGY